LNRRRFAMLGATAAAVAATLSSVGAHSAAADVTLPAVIAENMVLQQKAPVRIFGMASPGENVSVTMQGQTAKTTAGPDGKWAVMLKPLKAGGPYELVIKGNNEIKFSNILVGEVWVCSGQSNMEWSLKNAFEGQKSIDASANPQIRLFNVKNVRSNTPLTNVEATWQECKPGSVDGFSAVGYYFGRDLQKAQNVPIGLLQADWGGTPAEAWTPVESIAMNETLRPLIEGYPAAYARYEKALADYPAVVEKAKAEGKEAPRRPNAPWRYAELYNAMIAPLTPYTIKGAIWYQGESNAGRAAQYRTLFPTMISSWRQAWGEGDFPFLLVQLAPFQASGPNNTEYAELREAQLYSTQALPNVGMAVITDVGEEKDIHPKKKEPVGSRLALLARKMVYGDKVLASGPTLKDVKMDGKTVKLRFENVGDGLVAQGGDISQRTVEAGKLLGFTVAGEDGKFVPAEAKIVGKDTVEVTAAEIEKPMMVRYGFQNFPVVNLYNKAGLPATPFRYPAPK
jgi:sialate O-acetylesterase